MVDRHASDSSEQQAAEAVMLEAAGPQLGFEVRPRRIGLPGGASVDVDGYCADPLTFVEAYARQGRARGGQVKKIQGDTLKLVTLRHSNPGARLVLLFGSPELARAAATGWLGEAISTFGIEVLVVDLDDELRARLIAAQKRQQMVNPVAPGAGGISATPTPDAAP